MNSYRSIASSLWGFLPNPPHATHGRRGDGLTACSGDGARDTVENTPMIVCGHACGGTDGARHAPNDLPRRLSGL
jgi:hypothetical protein